MARQWTFGQKIALGFAGTVALAMVIAAIAVYALRAVVASKDQVIHVDSRNLVDAERMRSAAERKSSDARAYLLARDDRQLDDMRRSRADFLSTLSRLNEDVAFDEGRRLLAEIERAERDYQEAIDGVVAQRRADATAEATARSFEETVVPKRLALEGAVDAFVNRQEGLLADATRASTEAASSAIDLVVAVSLVVVLVAVAFAVTLGRSLARQIGTAVGHVQSSSAELQAAANQQATGAKEQATAMSEIATTITELLATSRQIAESAQRVAQIAGETASAARGGRATVEKAHASIAEMRRHIDGAVGQVVDLGKKSQQIGSVLEIVSELAEQTNILAINATIEAAGAGEAGKRFGVVADEIRKLADRVAASTKEIRALIDGVRGSVNTTVMATETGSKAVDAGSRQFGEVAASLEQVAGLVGTTTDAAREIELSTKQQATAVEQVKVAIANVAQATKETEVSSSQTLQTASQLTTLSRELSRMVKAEAGAAA